VGKGGFDGIDPLDDDVLIRAGGTIQHRTQRQRRQLVQQPDAGIGQHMERRMVGERGGHAVQHIAQHPAARHPCAERQAASSAVPFTSAVMSRMMMKYGISEQATPSRP